MAGWNAGHPKHIPLRLAVKVTPLLLGDLAKVEMLEQVATSAGLDFNLIDIELTETAFASPTPAVLASIDDLRRRGARLGVDDFGTGYSSLISLANLPFDVLKIDRSLVTPLGDSEDKLLVTAMTGIAQARGLQTIAEGVETAAQLSTLISAECDQAQGYLFSRPLEAADLGKLPTMELAFDETITSTRLQDAPWRKPVATTHMRQSGQARPARVLIVEDNPADLHLLKILLGSIGHHMYGLADPRNFLRALHDIRPDLILMDLRLHGTTGFDLVELAGDLITMPVMAVTGYPDWAIKDDKRHVHFTEVLAKPIDATDLFSRVDRLLVERELSTA